SSDGMEGLKHAFPPRIEPHVACPSCCTVPSHWRSADPPPATFITRGGGLPASHVQLHTWSHAMQAQGSDSSKATHWPTAFRCSSTPSWPFDWSTQIPSERVFFTRMVTAVGVSPPQWQEAAAKEKVRTTVTRANGTSADFIGSTSSRARPARHPFSRVPTPVCQRVNPGAHLFATQGHPCPGYPSPRLRAVSGRIRGAGLACKKRLGYPCPTVHGTSTLPTVQAPPGRPRGGGGAVGGV